MVDPISSIRNLGPALEKSFARAGIASAEELREMSADAGYLRLLHQGRGPISLPIIRWSWGCRGNHGMIWMTLKGLPCVGNLTR